MKKTLFFQLLILCQLSVFAQEKSTARMEVHIKIDEAIPGGKDTLWLFLDAGKNMGLKKGLEGTAVQVYRTDVRDYTILSDVWVTDVEEYNAEAYMLTPDNNKDSLLLKGDQVVFYDLALKASMDKDTLFRQLSAYNIIFSNIDGSDFYAQEDFLQASKVNRDSIFASFRQDVYETAIYLRDSIKDKPAGWTDTFTTGKHKGKNLIQALEFSSLLDIESFLRFVIEFPGKYIGHDWKINETFATWLINDRPMATNKNYLVDDFLALPTADLPRWSRENAFYLDTIKAYLDIEINELITAGKNEEAKQLLNTAALLAKSSADNKYLSAVYGFRGKIVQNEAGPGYHETAIKLFDQALQLDSLNWEGYWYRGNLYADRDQYDKAIADMKVLNRLYPEYASAWGNAGWWYLKQFKIKEAGPSCLNAYKFDSASSAWSVNLGHYYLLSGQNAKARELYQKTLENLETESDFITGPLSDFDFFEERGLLQEAFARERSWMTQKFDETYRHYLRSDSLFELAKEHFQAQDYKKAVAHFIASRSEELAAEKKRGLSIHNITTWVAYTYAYLNEFDKSESTYMAVLADAKKNFPSQITNDLELIAEMYEKWGNKAMGESYRSQAAAWKRKQADETSVKDLYVVSIGINEYKDLKYKWASSDAEKIAEELKIKGKRYDHTFIYSLTNKEALSDSVDKTMQEVIAKAKEDDTFVFYFTGKAINNEEESFLLPYGTNEEDADSVLLKKAISAQLLRSWSNSINAKHQLFLLDADATNFSSAFANQSSSYSQSLQQKDLMILSASFPRIERPETGSSVIAASLTKLFSDSVALTENLITGKKIENFFAEEISRNNYYLPIESYSQGRDFVLAETNYVPQQRTVAIVDDKQSTSRGVHVDNVSTSSANKFSLNKRYGLFIATDAYSDKKWPALNNPIADARALEKTLEEDYGFDIEILPNPTKTQIFNKIDEYSKKKFDKNDQLVILFAGHGYYDARRNEGYLVPTEATFTDNEFDRYYYPMSSIMRDLKIIPANHTLVLVDACHGGAISESGMARGDGDLYSNLSMDQLLKSHLEFPNRLVVTSGRKDQKVPDGEKGKNSPFIAAILDALNSKEAREKGIVSYFQLMRFISEKQKTTATSNVFSANDNWNFMFFYNNKSKAPIADPTKLTAGD